jgi:CheY-like chemotaxis protein
MGEVAIESLAELMGIIFAFCSPVKHKVRFYFACPGAQALAWKFRRAAAGGAVPPGYTGYSTLRKTALAEVGILIVDDDITSQQALKHILDSEGWRVRIVPEASHALRELASGQWNLAIVNAALIDLRGPLFAILRDLAQAEPVAKSGAGTAPGDPAARMIRVLFLLAPGTDRNVQAVLEQEELPYSWKPCHLHDFLEKVSDLLVDGGAIPQPLRSISGFSESRKRRTPGRFSREAGRGTMFASREDYQMTEEDLAEFEQQEETDRKKRQKKPQDTGVR